MNLWSLLVTFTCLFLLSMTAILLAGALAEGWRSHFDVHAMRQARRWRR